MSRLLPHSPSPPLFTFPAHCSPFIQFTSQMKTQRPNPWAHHCCPWVPLCQETKFLLTSFPGAAAEHEPASHHAAFLPPAPFMVASHVWAPPVLSVAKRTSLPSRQVRCLLATPRNNYPHTYKLVQFSPSPKCFFVTEGNYHRDPQVVKMQRIRDHGVPSPVQMTHLHHNLLGAQETSQKRECKDSNARRPGHLLWPLSPPLLFSLPLKSLPRQIFSFNWSAPKHIHMSNT